MTRDYTQNIHRAGASFTIDPMGRVMMPSARAIKREWRNAQLPYGLWRCEDGRVVLFNRHYQPIYERLPGGIVQHANRYEWVAFVQQEFIYDDGTPIGKSILLGLRQLQSWGVLRP
jgi:hypothetical protein